MYQLNSILEKKIISISNENTFGKIVKTLDVWYELLWTHFSKLKVILGPGIWGQKEHLKYCTSSQMLTFDL